MSQDPTQFPPTGSPQPTYGAPAGGQSGGYPGEGISPGANPGGYPAAPAGQPAYGTPYGPPSSAGFGLPPDAGRSKRWYRRWWVWLIIVIALLVIGAVAWGSGHVSNYELEKKVKQAFSDQKLVVSNVHCPDNVKTGKGSTTTCTGVYQGTTRTFSIRFDRDRHFLITDAR